MQIEVLQGNAMPGETRSRWSEIQQASPELASPYFCPEFAEAVASVRNDVWIGVLEQASTIVGFFPFQKGPLGIGKPLAGPLSDFQGLIADDSLEMSAAELIRGCGLVAWDFDHLLASQAVFHNYHANLPSSPFIDLSEGYENYQRGHFSRLKSLRNKLRREVGSLRFEPHVSDPQVLRQALAWKSAQYRETGQVDVFKFDWAVKLLERLIDIQSKTFAGLLSALWAGDRLVATHVGMRSATVWHYWFPAYDRQFARYSPGLLMLLAMAESCESMGLRRIDLGKGEMSYKTRFMNGSIPLAEGSVTSSSWLSLVRQGLQRTERIVRESPLRRIARLASPLVRRAQSWLAFR